MNLDSVRNLKSELHEVLDEIPVPAGAGYRVQRGGADRLTHSPVALGVAPAPDGEFRLAVRVQDEALLQSSLMAAIRERANDEVDVQFIGEAWAAHAGFDPRARCRPLRIGCSVGTRSSKATGTLACFVAPQDGGPIALLSNNHVLADEGRAAAGAATLQPGWDDSGRERSDTVARLDTVIGLSSAAVNEFDCATAILAEGVEADRASIEGVGTLSGVTDPEGDAEVAKVGRTSALTHGRIAAVEVGPVPFQYGTGLFAFDDLVEIHGAGTQRFAQGGDSGSLVVERDSCHAVGMVMGITTRGGGNGAGITYANDLPRTLEKLRMRVVL